MRTDMRSKLGWALFVGYVATIVLANYAIHHWGTAHPFGPHTVPVGWTLTAPSGVYFVGLALVLRNGVQRHLGLAMGLFAVAVGCVISWFAADPGLAVASACAFGLSEFLDFAVYSRLRRHGQVRAVLPAALIGAALDSYVFLRIAFHSEAFWRGQMLGKAYGVLGAALVLWLLEVVPRPRRVELA